MDNSKLLNALLEEQNALQDEKEEITARLKAINYELDMVTKLIDSKKKGVVTEVDVKDNVTPGAKILHVLNLIGRKATKPEIMAGLIAEYKITMTQAENLCRNHLSTLINENKITFDDEGTRRVYILKARHN